MKRSEIEQLLPVVFQRTLHPGTPLWALLEVMEAMHSPPEVVLSRLETLFNPYQTPDRFVPFLARWVDLDRFFPTGREGPGGGLTRSPLSSGLGRLRELLLVSATLSQWRGTGYGLRLFLEVATGLAGFEIDEQPPGEDGAPRPFHLLIRAPQQAADHRRLMERIVEQEKPAYVTYELRFGATGER